jgi:hypothetical protein
LTFNLTYSNHLLVHSRRDDSNSGLIVGSVLGGIAAVLVGFGIIMLWARHLYNRPDPLPASRLPQRHTPPAWRNNGTSASTDAQGLPMGERSRITINKGGETVLALAGPDPSRVTAQEQQERALQALGLSRLEDNPSSGDGSGAQPQDEQINSNDTRPEINPELLQRFVNQFVELQGEVDRLRSELRDRNADGQESEGERPPAYHAS